MTIPKEVRTKRVRQLFDAPHAKPPFRVPSMAEIAAVTPNGLTVATTFAGAGGSSTGYRMAGYRVVWANEFVPLAADSYEANMAEGTIVDRRDIQEVTPEDVLRATGLAIGELDLFDGSPPCQAFSTAGLRERGWGTERKYQNGKSQKNEQLFWEYIRLRDGLQPRTFVAENVSGLVKGAAKGYFLEILKLLKRGYRVEARILDAQWLGVPQQRQRVIFIGVREDLGLEPAFPSPLPYRYSIRDALPWLGRELVSSNSSYEQTWRSIGDAPSPTITATLPNKSLRVTSREAVVSKNSSATFAHKNRDTPVDEVSPTVMARRPNLEVGIEYRGRPGAKTWKPGSAPVTRRQSLDKPSQPITADGYAGAARHQAHVVFRGGPGDKPRGEKVGDLDEPAHTIAAGGYGSGARNQVAIVRHRKEFSHEMLDVTDRPAPTITSGGKADNSCHWQVEERLVQGPEVDFKNKGARIDMEKPAPAIAAGDAGKRTPRQFEVERVRYANGRSAPLDITNRPAPPVTGHANYTHFEVEVRKIANGEHVGENVAASIEGYAIGAEYDRLNPGQASDKFFNLVRPDAGKPVPTITSQGSGGGEAGGSPGGVASVCHPTEKRKFTILELKRLCGFPDDMILVGTYAQQWERCGNSVPPVMMMWIASAIRDKVLLPAKEREQCQRRESGSGRRSTSAGKKNAGPGRHRSPEEATGTSGTESASSRPTSTRSRKNLAADSTPGNADSTPATTARAAIRRTSSKGRKKTTSPT